MKNDLISYKKTISDIKAIIDSGRNAAYSTTSQIMIMTYWNIGKRIVEEEQNGSERAEYGKSLINVLSTELTKEYGQGYTSRNLRNFRQFYLFFPEPDIWHACVPNLRWTHFRTLLRVSDENARLWYMNEASKEGWDYRTLDRNISTQYYYRLLESPRKDEVISEMKDKTSEYQNNPAEIIKSPVICSVSALQAGFHKPDQMMPDRVFLPGCVHLWQSGRK